MKVQAEVCYRPRNQENQRIYLLGEDNKIYLPKSVQDYIRPCKAIATRLLYDKKEDITRILDGSFTEYCDGTTKTGENFYGFR